MKRALFLILLGCIYYLIANYHISQAEFPTEMASMLRTLFVSHMAVVFLVFCYFLNLKGGE
jgi:hypothetical protein